MSTSIGHFYLENKSVFRVYAPLLEQLDLNLIEQHRLIPMHKDELGYWMCSIPALSAGSRYMLRVKGKDYPDPASRSQPDGVHKASAVVANYVTTIDPNWRGIKIDNAIIYELHLGTFTPEGNLAALTARLDYLQNLGINVIELLPLNAFPGQRNWGYDGVYQFALQSNYGTLQDLQELINQAHSRGIAVILDVVYNHFGPEGNYSAVFAPLMVQAETPWGAAINFDQAYSWGIREFFLANVRFWLEEVKFDGFRMDAVSCIYDNSSEHILRDIVDLAKSIGTAQNREIIMIAEHLRNDRWVTNPRKYNYDSQWNDDLNYAIFSYLTKETTHNYQNFGQFADILKALNSGFVMDGSRKCNLYKTFKGSSGVGTHPREHIVHIQDHDQVGNRAHGDRMISSYGRAKALLGITAVLASPYIPMLFMGEEYGETQPFWFFTDFNDASVISGVRNGRKREFSYQGYEPLDPQSEAAFLQSKLDWHKLTQPEHQQIFEYYQQLIRLKKHGVIGAISRDNLTIDAVGEVIIMRNLNSTVYLNFGANSQTFSVECKLLLSSDSNTLITQQQLTLNGFCAAIVQTELHRTKA